MKEQGIENHIRVGEMPKIQYFNEASPNGKTRWYIGTDTYSLDGQFKRFAYFRTLPLDLSTQENRMALAIIVAKWKIVLNTDAAIGPGADVKGSNRELDFIAPPLYENTVGLYVDSKVNRKTDIGHRYERLPRWDILKSTYPHANKVLRSAFHFLPALTEANSQE